MRAARACTVLAAESVRAYCLCRLSWPRAGCPAAMKPAVTSRSFSIACANCVTSPPTIASCSMCRAVLAAPAADATRTPPNAAAVKIGIMIRAKSLQRIRQFLSASADPVRPGCLPELPAPARTPPAPAPPAPRPPVPEPPAPRPPPAPGPPAPRPPAPRPPVPGPPAPRPPPAPGPPAPRPPVPEPPAPRPPPAPGPPPAPEPPDLQSLEPQALEAEPAGPQALEPEPAESGAPRPEPAEPGALRPDALEPQAPEPGPAEPKASARAEAFWPGLAGPEAPPICCRSPMVPVPGIRPAPETAPVPVPVPVPGPPARAMPGISTMTKLSPPGISPGLGIPAAPGPPPPGCPRYPGYRPRRGS